MKAPPAHPSCTRLFEVEALRDGRLTGTEVTRFQSHVRSCSVCAQELSALQGLATALRSTVTQAEDELRVRRERTRLLAAFDASLMPSSKPSRRKLWFGALGGLAAALALALLLHPSRTVAPVAPAAPVAAAPDSVKVEASTATQWSRRVEASQETITIESGTLSIRVEHQHSQRRLLVLVPDGALEDIGTTFSVTVAAARTTHVEVQDGTVTLRLRDRPAITLLAGEAWSPAPAEATSGPSADAPPPDTRGHERTVRSVASARASSVPSSTPTLPPRSVALPDAAGDFRAAMAAFTRGDHALASSLFAAFLSQHPADSRSEDAAYLRVLTLQRAGDVSGMRKAASEYLERYPGGFRASEVKALSR